jgi:hypothetical protein
MQDYRLKIEKRIPYDRNRAVWCRQTVTAAKKGDPDE